RLDQHRAVRAGFDRVGNVRKDAPRPTGPEFACLAADLEAQPSLEQDPELLVFMRVLGQDGIGIQLDQSEREPIAVNRSAENSFPDLLRSERADLGERLHTEKVSRFEPGGEKTALRLIQAGRAAKSRGWALVLLVHQAVQDALDGAFLVAMLDAGVEPL